MNTKTYLSQARYLDMRIKSKLQQVDSLNDLATTCTSVMTGMLLFAKLFDGSFFNLIDAEYLILQGCRQIS